MTFLLSAVGGGAAAGAAASTAAATGSGLSISSILQGLTTIGGLVASVAAGNAEAMNLEMQANDAEAEKGFETVQSVDRKRSLLAEAQEAVGELDVATASSGVDLSVGSAREARTRAYRETDLGLTTDSATTAMRLDRLTERAKNFRAMAKRAKSMGWLNGILGGLGGLSSLAEQM